MIMNNLNQRKPFLSINDDDVDAKLEQLAADKGVGKMEKPRAAGDGAGEGTASEPTAESSKINFEGPAYLATALKIKAAQERTSVRYLIMKALRASGFEINDADMVEDGRRLRGSNKLQ
jgi:hypothetical protein